MGRPLLSLILLGTLLSVGGGFGLRIDAVAQSATPQAEPSRDVVVLADVSSTPRLHLVDPVRGAIGDWITGSANVQPSVIPGPAGVLFASLGAVDRRGTDLFAISTESGTVDRLAHLSGQARLWGISASGNHLLALTFRDGLPVSAASVALPKRWQGSPAPVALGAELADGVGLAPPLRWFGLDGDRRLWLATVQAQADTRPDWVDLGFTIPSAYWSIVVAPDGHAIYVVDFYHQRIAVINVNRKEVTQSLSFGDERFKRPICAAALNPRGDRLYVLANKYNSGDGILVFDTRSWRQLDHLLQGENFSCLIVSPDGHRLYATNADSLITIDAQTGAEQQTVKLDLDVEHADPWPLLAVTVSS